MGTDATEFNAQAAYTALYEYDNIPGHFGLNNDIFFNADREKQTSVMYYPSTGSIHGVGGFVEHHEDGRITLKIEHWLHEPNNKNIRTPFLEIELDKQGKRADRYAITSAKLQGNDLDITNSQNATNIEAMFAYIYKDLRNERQPPNLMEAASRFKFKVKALPGVFKTGAIKRAYQKAGGRPERTLDIPTDYVDSLLGVDRENVQTKGRPLYRYSTLNNPEVPSEKLKQSVTFLRGKTANDSKTYMSGDINQSFGHSESIKNNEASLFDIVLRPKGRKKQDGTTELTTVKSLQILGTSIDKNGHKDLVRGLNFIRDYSVPTLANTPTSPQEIIGYTHLQEEISPLPSPKPNEKHQAFIRPLGGSPTGTHIENEEEGIGANSWLFIDREQVAPKEYQSTVFGLDGGIKPLDPQKTGFDFFLPYFGDFFAHRTNTKHKPKMPAAGWLITERHLDHTNGLPMAVMAGYKMPPIYCSETTKHEFIDILKKNGVDKSWYPKFNVIEDGDEFEIDNVKIKAIATPHSTKSFAYKITFSNGATYEHFGDTKLSPVASHGPESEEAFLKILQDHGPVDAALVDGTRITQKEQAKSERDLLFETLEAVESRPHQQVISTHIGSNMPRLLTDLLLCAKTGRSLVIFGDALKRARTQLNIKCLDDDKKENFITLMQELGLQESCIAGVRAALSPEEAKTHGDVTIRQYGHYKGKQPTNSFKDIAKILGVKETVFSNNNSKANEIIHHEDHWLVFSGTHFETKSWMHKFVHRTHPIFKEIQNDRYFIIASQYAIPGSEKKFNMGYHDLKRRGFEVEFLHTSGHDGQEAWAKMLKAVDTNYVITGHGDTKQRQAIVDFATEEGYNSIDPGEQDFIEIKPGELKIVAQQTSARIYARAQRPDGKYWGTHEDYDYYASRSLPAIRSTAGQLIQTAHHYFHAPQNQVEAARRDATKLVTSTREVEDPMLATNEAKSFRPRQHRVKESFPDWKVRNSIFFEAMYDVETNTLGPYASTWQFAMQKRNAHNKVTEKINLRCKFDEDILFDLEGMIAIGAHPRSFYELGLEQREFAFQMYESFDKMRAIRLIDQKTLEPKIISDKVREKMIPVQLEHYKDSEALKAKIKELLKDAQIYKETISEKVSHHFTIFDSLDKDVQEQILFEAYKFDKKYEGLRQKHAEELTQLNPLPSPFSLNSKSVSYIDKSKQPEDPRIKVKKQNREDNKTPPDQEEIRKRERRVHPYMRKTIKPVFNSASIELKPDRKHSHVKGLVGGFNNPGFDDPQIRQTCFFAGYADFFPTNKNMRRYDVRNFARAFYYLRPDRYKVQTKGETDPNCAEKFKDQLDFTVKGLALANKIRYSEDAAHDADYDVDLQFRILDHMKKLDPELFTQMMMNTHKPQIKSFLRGSQEGHIYQRPLITYIDTRALDAQRHVGFMVGTSNIGKLSNKAVLFNVEDFDPLDFYDLSADEMARIMSNPKDSRHKAFNIIDMSKNPIVTEAHRSFNLGIKTPREQMEERKRFVERNPDFVRKIIQALEKARYYPDADATATLHARYMDMAAFKMDTHDPDKELMLLFEPCDKEFVDEEYAASLNQQRVEALDKLQSTKLRERYVMQLYRDKNARHMLHNQDFKYARALSRAYFCGEVSVPNPFNSPVSIYQLRNQVEAAKEKYADDISKGTLTGQIILEAEEIVQERMNNKELFMTAEDREIIRLYSPEYNRTYAVPPAKNDNIPGRNTAEAKLAP